MFEGRTEEQKQLLAEKVTQAVHESIGASKESIVVFIEDMKKEDYAVGGKLFSQR